MALSNFGPSAASAPSAPSAARVATPVGPAPWVRRPAVRSGQPAAARGVARPGRRAARTTAGCPAASGTTSSAAAGAVRRRAGPSRRCPRRPTGRQASGAPAARRGPAGEASARPTRPRRTGVAAAAAPVPSRSTWAPGPPRWRWVPAGPGVGLVRGFRQVRGYGWGGRLVGDRRVLLRLRARGAPVGRPCSRLGLRHRGNLLSRRSEVSTAPPPPPIGRARDSRRANAYPWAS